MKLGARTRAHENALEMLPKSARIRLIRGLAAASLGALALLSGPRTARASEGAPGPALVLSDGTRVEGRVLEVAQDRFVVVSEPDGRREVFAWSQIDSLQGVRVTHAAAGGALREGFSVQGTGIGFTTRLDAADEKRRAWTKRGGGLVSYDLHANATGILLPNQDLVVPSTPCITSQGQVASTRGGATVPARSGGGGGGIGGRLGFMYASLPKGEGGTWAAFKLATGADVSFLGMRVAAGLQPNVAPPGCATQYNINWQGTSFMSVQVPFQIGAHIGLGGFGDPQHWRGVVVGLNYSPSYQYSKVLSSQYSSEGSGSFNAAGFELDVDFASLEATLQKYGEEAHVRVTVFVLPPIKEDMPLIGVFGIGAVWY